MRYELVESRPTSMWCACGAYYKVHRYDPHRSPAEGSPCGPERVPPVESETHWRARAVGDNNEIVWWTESYTRKEAALDAIRMLRRPTHYDGRVIGSGYDEEVQIIEVTE